MAQVALTMRLIEVVIPVRTRHVVAYPEDITKANSLIGDTNRVQLDAHKVPPNFPQTTLQQLNWI